MYNRMGQSIEYSYVFPQQIVMIHILGLIPQLPFCCLAQGIDERP